VWDFRGGGDGVRARVMQHSVFCISRTLETVHNHAQSLFTVAPTSAVLVHAH